MSTIQINDLIFVTLQFNPSRVNRAGPTLVRLGALALEITQKPKNKMHGHIEKCNQTATCRRDILLS